MHLNYGGSVEIWPLSISLVVPFCCPAVKDGSVSTVFVGWGVGLVCDGLSLLVFSVRFICSCCLGFGSLFVFAFAFLLDWSEARLLFFRFDCLLWIL